MALTSPEPLVLESAVYRRAEQAAPPRSPSLQDDAEDGRYRLPKIVDERSLLRRLLIRLRLLGSLERWGWYHESPPPFLVDGQLNPDYAHLFHERFFVKSFYSAAQLAYLPQFPLIGKHPGERFIVFGNGPSLKQCDFSRIRTAVTIGTNTSSEFYHARYVLISSPFAFLRAQPFFDFRKSILLVARGMWNGRTRKELWSRYEDRIVPVEFGEGPWSLRDGRLVGSGDNVGQAAVDIAILMGARSILLVGCDGYNRRTLQQMYAGRYEAMYRRALAKRVNLRDYERMLWARDEQVHAAFEEKQRYCQQHGIAFGVWGKDCRYDRLHRVSDEQLAEWY